jgi:hypothetical protein
MSTSYANCSHRVSASAYRSPRQAPSSVRCFLGWGSAPSCLRHEPPPNIRSIKQTDAQLSSPPGWWTSPAYPSSNKGGLQTRHHPERKNPPPGMEPLTRQSCAIAALASPPRVRFSNARPPSRTYPHTAGASRSRVQCGGSSGSRSCVPDYGRLPRMPGNGPAKRIGRPVQVKKIMPPEGQTNMKEGHATGRNRRRCQPSPHQSPRRASGRLIRF